MDKFVSILQLLGSVLLAITTAVTIHNLWNIASNRPDSISVVNTIIGQGVLIVCLAALATVLFRKGWKGFKAANNPSEGEDSSAT